MEYSSEYSTHNCLKTDTGYFHLFKRSIEQIAKSLSSLELTLTGFKKEPDKEELLPKWVSGEPAEVANNMVRISTSLEHINSYMFERKMEALEIEKKKAENEELKRRAEEVNK